MGPPSPNDRTCSAFAQPEQVAELTELMLRTGYPDGDMRAILGGNWLHLAREVWR